jgi:hypothetical protein
MNPQRNCVHSLNRTRSSHTVSERTYRKYRLHHLLYCVTSPRTRKLQQFHTNGSQQRVYTPQYMYYVYVYQYTQTIMISSMNGWIRGCMMVGWIAAWWIHGRTNEQTINASDSGLGPMKVSITSENERMLATVQPQPSKQNALSCQTIEQSIEVDIQLQNSSKVTELKQVK